MNESVSEEERRRFEIRRDEYRTVEIKWRFFQQLRYAVFGGVIVAHGALVTLYASMASTVRAGSIGLPWGNLALMFLALIAIALAVAGMRLEQRLRSMYSGCSERGAELERLFGEPAGIFNKLLTIPRPSPLNHTEAIQLVAIFILMGWTTLVIAALFIGKP